jgi:HK97 family phage major capsid protein
MRWLSCLYDSDGMAGEARYKFGLRFPRALNLELVTKAAVGAMTTTDSTAAGPLAGLKPLTDAFLALVRPRTLLGKIQNLRRVPFNTSVVAQTTGGTYTWVGQSKPKPVTKADYATVSLGFAKAAGIIIVSEELANLSRPGADVALRGEMVAGMSQFLDMQFVDPAVAKVVGVSPGSVTNGATSIASSGATEAAARTDFKALNASFTAATPDFEFAVLLMSPANAGALAIATDSKTLTIAGGSFLGYRDTR